MAGNEESGDSRASSTPWELHHYTGDSATALHHRPLFSNNDQSAEQMLLSDQADNARYLDELVKDMRTLDSIQASHPDKLRNAYALLTAEIDRVWSLIYTRSPCHKKNTIQCNFDCTSYSENVNPNGSPTSESKFVTIQEKIMIPQRPDCKFIGRILGPRGISVKQLEAQTDCRILIRGKGSVKDSRREARLRNRAGWEHLSEPLHVLVTASDVSHERCAKKLANGVHSIKALLSSNNDEHKRCQLVQLAIINGTYRPTRPQGQ